MSLLWISPTSRKLHTQPDCWPKISVNAGQPAALIVSSCCVTASHLRACFLAADWMSFHPSRAVFCRDKTSNLAIPTLNQGVVLPEAVLSTLSIKSDS